MARIRYGSIVSDVSGSIGSATFQKSLYGNTLRSKPLNNRTATAKQQLIRSYMQACQAGWRALSSANRNQWNQFIAFSGQSINRDRNILITGHALFLKWNFARLVNGLAIVSTLVYSGAPQWPNLTTIRTDGDVMIFDFDQNLNTLQVFPTFFLSNCSDIENSFSASGLRHISAMSVGGVYMFGYNNYLNVFGRKIYVNAFLNFKYQFWSTVSPILSSVRTGVIKVTAI
jgi:hypothetical protein